MWKREVNNLQQYDKTTQAQRVQESKEQEQDYGYSYL